MESKLKTSPVLTIKRAGPRGANNAGWQEFIEREHNTVDDLLKDSFATLCRQSSNNNHHKARMDDQDDFDDLPPGIRELESLYAPMKNLSRPLPSVIHDRESGAHATRQPMPVPHPLGSRHDDDVESILAEVPPPPRPVQSHAILEHTFCDDGYLDMTRGASGHWASDDCVGVGGDDGYAEVDEGSPSPNPIRDLLDEVAHKRQLRVGLNLFNMRPTSGIEFLVRHGLIDLSPDSVARFLDESCSSGLSLARVGEYLTSGSSDPFATRTLSCFVDRFDFAGLRVDKALRRFLLKIRIPGEPQKVERAVDAFGRRYCQCNVDRGLSNVDAVVALSFAIILLNTDLHSDGAGGPSRTRMSFTDFADNLRTVEASRQLDAAMLRSVYKSIKRRELTAGVDHVARTLVLQRSIASGPTDLARPHRRLVCICRLYEGLERSRPRDLFLFNDLLVITKMAARSTRSNPMYEHRDAWHLAGLDIVRGSGQLDIHIVRRVDGVVLGTFQAASDQDRYKFVTDLQESIYESEATEKAFLADTI